MGNLGHWEKVTASNNPYTTYTDRDFRGLELQFNQSNQKYRLYGERHGWPSVKSAVPDVMLGTIGKHEYYVVDAFSVLKMEFPANQTNFWSLQWLPTWDNPPWALMYKQQRGFNFHGVYRYNRRDDAILDGQSRIVRYGGTLVADMKLETVEVLHTQEPDLVDSVSKFIHEWNRAGFKKRTGMLATIDEYLYYADVLQKLKDKYRKDFEL